MRDPRSGREPLKRSAIVLLGTLSLFAGCATEPADPDPPPFGPQPLVEYRERFYRAIRDAEARPAENVNDTILARRFLLFGDRHDDEAFHEDMIERIATLIRREERPALVLEAFSDRDDEDLTAFREGKIDAGVLENRALARDAGHWLGRRDDIDVYSLQYMLRICSELDCPTFGLEPSPKPSLDERVPAMERKIRRIANELDATRVVVWVGRAHTVGPGSLGERMKDDAVVILGSDPGILEGIPKSHEIRIEDHAPVVVWPIKR